MISRDWMCENPKCGLEFHSFDRIPVCPECGCVRLKWIPGGGHIGSEKTRRSDATLRGFADQYGVKNWSSPSPSRNNRAMEKYEQPPFDYNAQPVRFGPFSSPVSSYGATCTTSTSPVNIGGKVSIGTIDPVRQVNMAAPRTASDTVPGPKRNASITYLRKK